MTLSVPQYTQSVRPENIMENKVWTAELLEDPQDSEGCILPFPEDMLAEIGWQEGDTVVWDIQADGTVILTKKAQYGIPNPVGQTKY